MSKIIRAEITPSIISWAIRYANIDIDVLAKRVGVKTQQIKSWDAGTEYPTINQLLKFAKICDVPFSLFFFENPPDDIPLPVDDFRKIYSEYGDDRISYELTLEIRKAIRIRKLALDVFEDLEIEPPSFSFFIDSTQDSAYIAREIRGFLGITFQQQRVWKAKRIAFNNWRRALENQSIIVLQSTTVDVKTMRGFSLSDSPLPVIVINRKDELSGRIFSLLHEFIHIATRTSGLCDFLSDDRIEVYCNHLAAECLMPREEFTKEVFTTISSLENPTDSEIRNLSNVFSVSSISIVRHLYSYGFISKNYYQLKQEQYKQEFESYKNNKKETKGYLIRRSAVDTISQNGYLFPSLVIDAYHEQKLTSHDAVSMLNMKSRHLNDLISKLAENSLEI